jgi:uncharacterized protein (DUF362 family)
MLATRPDVDTIAIARTFEGSEEAAHRVIEQVGGMSSVLKGAKMAILNLSMKNCMGILPRPDRRSMHTLGIDQSIVDMNRSIKPDLTIVDGGVGQDGEGPLYGGKADLQVLVAGRDSLAVDLVCCQVVGVKPRDIPHLKVNYATCQRCLLCYEACPENAISVKGYSGARQ